MFDIKAQATWLIFLAVLFAMSSAWAELRDPTRPSGYYTGMMENGVDEPDQPSALRLQAVFYNPAKPSVLINGRRLVIGDQIADSIVKTINQKDVILSTIDGEKVLKLETPSVKSRSIGIENEMAGGSQ